MSTSNLHPTAFSSGEVDQMNQGFSDFKRSLASTIAVILFLLPIAPYIQEEIENIPQNKEEYYARLGLYALIILPLASIYFVYRFRNLNLDLKHQIKVPVILQIKKKEQLQASKSFYVYVKGQRAKIQVKQHIYEQATPGAWLVIWKSKFAGVTFSQHVFKKL